MDDILDRVAKITGSPFKTRKPRQSPYDDLFEKHGLAEGVDPDLLRAMTNQESRFNPRAKSHKNAEGLMQLIPDTAARFGVSDVYDPDQNVRGGAKYMRWLLDRFDGDVDKALAGYNAGEGAVDKYGGIPPYRETQDYVKKIRGNYQGPGYAQRFKGDDNDLLSNVGRILGGVTAPATAPPDDAVLSRVDTILGTDKKGGATPSPTFPSQSGPPVDIKPAPEAPATIEAQSRSVIDANSPRAAVLLTEPGQEKLLDPAMLKAFRRVETPQGVLLVNEAKAKALGVTDYQKDLAKLIGKVDDVGTNTATGPTVLTTDAQGRELASSVVTSPESAVKQAALDARSFLNEGPKSQLVDAQDVVEKRAVDTGAKTGDPLIDTLTAIGEASRKGEKYDQPEAPDMPQLESSQDNRSAYNDYLAYATKEKIKPMSFAEFEAKIGEADKDKFGKGAQASAYGLGETEPQRQNREERNRIITENNAAAADYNQRAAQSAQTGQQPQASRTSFGRQVGRANEDFMREIGTTTFDTKLSPERKLSLALNEQLSRYGVTPQEVDAYIKSNPNALKAAGPNVGQLTASFANLAEIKGDDFAREAMRTEQAEGRTDSNVGLDLNASKDWIQEDVNNLKEALGPQATETIGGYLGSGGRIARSVAGVVRPFNTNAYEAMQEVAETAERFELVAGQKDGWGVFKIVGGLPGDLSRMLFMTRLPGSGPVIGFAADSGLQSAGRGEGFGDIAKNTAKGAVLGSIFKFAEPVVGRIAAASPAVKSATGKAIFRETAVLGTIFSGTIATEKAFGTSDEQAIHQGVMNALFHLANQGVNLVGKRVRARDEKGNTVNVGVDKDGSVKLLKGKVEKPDVEMYFDAKAKMWRPVNEPVAQKPTTNEAAKEATVVPDGQGGYVRETKGLLGEQSPQRIETPDPTAVQKAGIDTRVGKVVEVLKKQTDFVDLDTLAKSTRMNRTNLEDAVMTLYGARMVELLPGNRVRLISEPKKTDLFEKAQTYGQEAPVSQPTPTSAPVTGTRPESTSAEIAGTTPTAQPNAAALEFKGKTLTHPISREPLTFTGEADVNGNLIATNNFGRERKIARASAEKWLAEQAAAPEAPPQPPAPVAEPAPQPQAVAEPAKPEPRPFKDPMAKHKSLAQFVRSMGGIRGTKFDKGEHRRISNKETGSTGLINKNSQYTAEMMAEAAWEAGYLRDVWPDIADRNGNDFMGFLEDDLHGTKKRFAASAFEESSDEDIRRKEDEYYAKKEREAIQGEAAKELWQITWDEFRRDPRVVNLFNNAETEVTRYPHENAVRQALRRGDPVPPEVLAEYPELARETKPAKPIDSDLVAQQVDDNAEAFYEDEPEAAKTPREMSQMEVDTILRSDDLEARRPIIRALFPDYVNTASPDYSNDFAAGLWGEVHEPKRWGPGRIPFPQVSERLKLLQAGKEPTYQEIFKPAEQKTNSRPTLHGVPPQELTPQMRARVLYAKDKGDAPADIAEKFNLTPEQVESVGTLPPVGKGGKMAQQIVRAMTPAKQATTAERGEKIAFVNDLAAELGLADIRLTRDTPQADVVNASHTIRRAIAKEFDKERSSHLTPDEWMQWLDNHADKLSYDSILAVLDAFGVQTEHWQKVEEFGSDPALKQILVDTAAQYGRDNLKSLADFPRETRRTIYRIGHTYGLKRTATERALGGALDQLNQEKLEEAGSGREGGEAPTASETEAIESGPREAEELAPTPAPPPPELGSDTLADEAPQPIRDMESLASFVKRLETGDVTPAQLKASFADVISNEEVIKAGFAKLSIPELKKRFHSYHAQKKAEWVDVAYSGSRQAHLLGKSEAFMVGGSGYKEAQLKSQQAIVDGITADDIAKYAEDVAARRKQRAERVASIKDAIKDPHTVEEFQTFLQYKSTADFTPEQKLRYDKLVAADTLKKRKESKAKSEIVEQVDIGDAEMTITKSFHTKHQKDVWIVSASEKLPRDQFDELNAKAKQLGGRYRPAWKPTNTPAGFQFFSEEAANKFTGLQEGDVDRSAELEARAKWRQMTTLEKLRDSAAKLREAAQESLSRDRLANTARRAAMAANAEHRAKYDIAFADTMERVADVIEKGETEYLTEIWAKTHFETLDRILRRAVAVTEAKEPKPNFQRLATEADIENAEYPYPQTWGHDKATLDRVGQTVDGVKLLARGLAKNVKFGSRIRSPKNLERLRELIKRLKYSKSTEGQALWWRFNDAVSEINRLDAVGLTNPQILREALREYLPLRKPVEEESEIKKLERELVGSNYGRESDYFPTPPELARRVADMADIRSGMTVLEPSAGKGNLLDAIREVQPEADIEAVEQLDKLRKITELKGYNLVGYDFLDFEPGKQYDRIVMNPPFKDEQEHIRKAYDLLKPGGRLVAITSPSWTYNKSKKAEEFRSFVESVGGYDEDLPEGSFSRGEVSTGVNTKLLVIDKSEATTDKPDILFSRTGAQTETAAFRKWFGDSKVVDENGEPLIVHHGTVIEGTTDARPGNLPAKAFTEFRKDLRGSVTDTSDAKMGFWFTESEGRAIDAAGDAKVAASSDGSAYVYDVYLKIENPLVFDDIWQYGPSEIARFARQAKKKGHDGLIFKRGEGGLPDYLVFEPTQIKSAIGNRGTFDPSSPNILMTQADLFSGESPKAVTKQAEIFRKAGEGKAEAMLMTAWHGSPHTFDKFDISKIGTGDGKQVGGHGLYFTDAEEVARAYKVPGGALYKVDLAPTDDELIHWELPYSEQPDIVQKAFDLFTADTESILDAFDEDGEPYYDRNRFEEALEEAKTYGGYGDRFGWSVWSELEEGLPSYDWNAFKEAISNGVEFTPSTPAENIYSQIATILGSPKAASAKLRELGVRGSKMEDRTLTQGGTNYIIFDDADVDIIETHFDKKQIERLRRHVNRTVNAMSHRQMLREAKFTQNPDNGLVEMNEAALESLTGAFQGIGILDKDGGMLGAALDAPNLGKLKTIWGKAVEVAKAQNLPVEARHLQRMLDTFDKFTHPVHGDIAFAYTSPRFKEITEKTAQEEIGHLADIRTNVNDEKSFEGADGYAEAQEHLRGQNYEEKMLYREITGKLQRDDAAESLGITQKQVRNLRKIRLKQIARAKVPLQTFLDNYGSISDANKRRAEVYARFQSKRARTDEPTERRDQRLEPSRSGEVRGGRDRRGGRPDRRPEDRPASRGFQFGTVLPEGREGTQSLISPSERREIAREVPGLAILFSRTEPLTTKEATFWNKWIKNKRETEIPQIIVNFRRAGLLTGFKTHLRNLLSNAANQASEEAVRVPAAVADLVASGFTGERAVQPPSPLGIVKSFLTLVKSDKALKELDQDSGISRAWNIIRNGSTEELKKNQVSEMRSGLPLLDLMINGTFRLLGAEDALFKTYAMRRSLEAQARTQAINDARNISKHNSAIDRERFIGRRQAEILANPSKGMLMEAMMYADFTTFTNNNPISDWFSKVKDTSKIGRSILEFVVPYDRTPTNIVLRTLEFTPAGLLWAGKHLSDRSKGKSYTFERLRQDYLDDFERLDANRAAARQKFDQKFKDALREMDARIKADPDNPALKAEKTKIKDTWAKVRGKRSVKDAFRESDRKELEDLLDEIFPRVQQMMFANSVGRASLGSAVLLLGMYLAGKGVLSGLWDPGEKDEKDEFYERRDRGILNGSLKLGNRRYQINDTPTGKTMVLGASIWERSQKRRKGQGETEDLLMDVADVGSNLVMEQPLLSSLDDYFGKNKTLEKRLGGLLGSFVPTIVSDLADVSDDEARRNEKIQDATMARIPGLRQKLPKAKYPREPYLRKQRNRITSKFDPTSSRPVEK